MCFLATDVADLPQAQAVLVGQHAARQAVGAFLLDLLVAQLAVEVVALGNFQGHAGIALDQGFQGLGREDLGQ